MFTQQMRRRGRFVALITAVLVSGLTAATVASGDTYAPEFFAELHAPGMVGGHFWPPTTDVTITADDPTTAVNPDYTVTITTDGQGAFGYGIPVRPGWNLTATGSGITKTFTVRDIAITDVDLATSAVRGTAVPGTLVPYVACGGKESVSASVDQSGVWSASLAGVCSIFDAGFANALLPSDPDWSVFTVYTWFVPQTLDEVLDNMVAHDAVPNQGLANSIVKQAAKAPAQALENHLSSLVADGVITQQTMDAILSAVAAQ